MQNKEDSLKGNERRDISFQFILENCKTIGDLKKLDQEVRK